jgi:hypothetical protein
MSHPGQYAPCSEGSAATPVPDIPLEKFADDPPITSVYAKVPVNVVADVGLRVTGMSHVPGPTGAGNEKQDEGALVSPKPNPTPVVEAVFILYPDRSDTGIWTVRV